MKFTAVLGFVFSILIAHPSAAQEPWSVLEGVHGVSPVVQVHLPPGVALLESDYEGQLQWILESQLRLAGIPLLESAGDVTLWVDINALDSGDGVVFAYNMELQEPAILRRWAAGDEEREACWVVSWHFGGVGHTGLDRLDLALREVVTELARGFTMDWTSANGAANLALALSEREMAPR